MVLVIQKRASKFVYKIVLVVQYCMLSLKKYGTTSKIPRSDLKRMRARSRLSPVHNPIVIFFAEGNYVDEKDTSKSLHELNYVY